jgi:Peptidase family M3
VPGPGVQFTLVNGRRLSGGAYQRPMVALVCNFPPQQQGRQAPLSVLAVQTLFHEFGHVRRRRAAYSLQACNTCICCLHRHWLHAGGCRAQYSIRLLIACSPSAGPQCSAQHHRVPGESGVIVMLVACRPSGLPRTCC